MKFFLIELETLVINMLKTPTRTHSSTKLTRIFEDIEPGFTYGDQWDCLEVMDIFFTQYQKFIRSENFDGKNQAQEVIDSLKVTMRISTQCNMCNNLEIREENESFLFVPLENDVENIFNPFYNNY